MDEITQFRRDAVALPGINQMAEDYASKADAWFIIHAARCQCIQRLALYNMAYRQTEELDLTMKASGGI